ncbi:LEAF RUST 10 DISEASE-RESISTANCEUS RECEPTOR-LIKE PROTEIN KINASE-like 1.2 isoform X4 [Lolium perenne]|uniref:LEAF RUST 10 DISEASE-RESISTANCEUS RECEPTOR-LIKE PROTEIN KINASE-like 1.2 isoform X4 n=1 Tax=Lolium perenne TaxID=4522 RepID=UPI0021F521F2|nr:LEAF RUST 10 DISEASE-RESISTANCE LOCUS RECEPTOR-LIKE PROTEIN KINASE-like 1.2 isoform X3 [Lolium perenne]
MAPGCRFLVFVWVWVWCLPLMPLPAEEQQQGEGESCSPRMCGNLNISSPFWLADLELERPCGPFDFEVTCVHHTPVLRSSLPFGRDFAILDISYEDGSLRVVDRYELNASQICHVPGWNTSVKLGLPFKISPADLSLILYNCTAAAAATAAARGDMSLVEMETCGSVRGRNRTFARVEGRYDATGDYAGYHEEGCDATVVPVVSSSSWGALSAREYKQLIGAGFLLTWDLHPPPPLVVAGPNRKITKKLKIGLGAGGGGIVIGCLAVFLWYNRKKRKEARTSSKLMRSGSSMHSSYSKDLELGGSPHIFTFEELEEATDGFCASRELGDGGFGTVYKGKLKDGRVVAVKRLYKNNYKRVEQFLNEVDILSRLLHQNLVILYGCTSRMSRDLLLVYEFIPNGTVADHLHGSRAAERGLTWPLRLNIAIETAEALAYLHAVEIIHRDVKTTNILLDNSFHVKVADFGLSRLFPLEVTHVSTVPQGTPGYVDPVYHQCYKLTDKSDVYSFGVVLVELISSKPAVDMSRSHSEINLANMALNRIQNHEVVQLVDPELGYDTDSETKGSIDCVAEVAFQCLQLERELRPSIKEVVEILNCIRDGDCPSKKMGKDASLKEDTHLLRGSLQFSPDSVIHRFHSQSTNHSVASNGSGV